MSKYDFGDVIKQGSTTDWAMKNIAAGSKVLEFGAAVGTLTRHLHEDKNCVVDIVEIDGEAGKRAALYARKSYIGEEQGNIETYYWYTDLQGEQYDYIVILDVLEHLREPQKLLKCVYELLNTEGILLLSVPNIAHNSVLIDMYNNKFEYSSLGLLDDTHIHFYSYEGLCKELDGVGLFPFSKEAIQLRVGENEITNSYQDVPPEMGAILRTRKFADVYQFLFQIRKKRMNDEEVLMQVENLPYTLFEMSIYNAAKELIFNKSINPRNKIDIEIEGGFSNEELLISLLNATCIIRNLTVKAVGREGDVLLPIERTNAAQIEDLNIFMDPDAQIIVKANGEISKIKIEGEILAYGAESLGYIKPIWKKLLEQNYQLAEYKDTQEKLYACIAQKESEIETLLNTIKKL